MTDTFVNFVLVDRADASKGRFRTFLLHALDQFLIDRMRRESTQKHIPKEKLVSLDMSHPPELPQTILERSPEDCFAYAWKSDLLERTLAQIQAECQQRGQQTHWNLFGDKVLGPMLYNRESEPMKAICTRYGVADESVAFNMLLTVKRRFKTALRRNLASTVAAEDDIDAEWMDILGFFGKNVQKPR